MAEWEASCEELIAAGYSEHKRCDVPPDWRTRRGPDPIPGVFHERRARAGRPRKRQTWQERRAAWLAAHGRSEEQVFSRANGDRINDAGAPGVVIL